MVAGAGSWLITFNHTQETVGEETVGEEKKERVNKSSKHTDSNTLPLAGLDLLQVPSPPRQKHHQGGPGAQIRKPVEEDICLIQANMLTVYEMMYYCRPSYIQRPLEWFNCRSP